jgi:hypothetical protein
MRTTYDLIRVAFVWRDDLDEVRETWVAQMHADATNADRDAAMDDERVFYVFEAGEPICQRFHDFEILEVCE